jgi:hypothetical protein
VPAAQLPVLCPNWEYQDAPGFDLLLRARTKSAMLRIRESAPSQLLDRAKNTRPVHGQYFRDLTPATTPYYAGNYRGQNELCLREYEVHIAGDPLVGHHPSVVVPEMVSLALVAILARHQVFLRRWQIHPRPQDPPYSDAIAQYRLGNRAYLERFVLNCI